MGKRFLGSPRDPLARRAKRTNRPPQSFFPRQPTYWGLPNRQNKGICRCPNERNSERDLSNPGHHPATRGEHCRRVRGTPVFGRVLRPFRTPPKSLSSIRPIGTLPGRNNPTTLKGGLFARSPRSALAASPYWSAQFPTNSTDRASASPPYQTVGELPDCWGVA